MLTSRQLDSTGLEEAYYQLFRKFFDQAERRRRWSLQDDIPWQKANPRVSPAIANVIESFCAVELFLPDYVIQALPMIRGSRGRAWFHLNWGYEEAKHSMALGDWLVRSGHRTEEQLRDLETQVSANQWDLPRDSPLGMVIYAMTQELATWLHYRNLLRHVNDREDPALAKLLRLICVDERSHHDFYKKVTQLYLARDRSGTIAELQRVLLNFRMPAVHLLAESRRRVEEIRALHIFDEDIFYRDVLRPILESMDIGWAEFRQRKPDRKAISTPALP
jgi:acyl-[acyl-carrier-protein] desaturase